MRMLSDLTVRMRAVFRRRAVERDMDEELRFHFERQVKMYEGAGLDRATAMRRARLEFGGLDQIKEEYRDALGVRAVDELRRDLRIAVRSLRATPVITAVAVLSLALAIGANTAIFSLINGLLLRPLPVKDPERLVFLTDTVTTRLRSWSYPFWDQIRQRPQLFEEATAWTWTRFNLASGGETRFIRGLWASGSFFRAFGVQAVLGRTFSEADDRRGGADDGPVAVISHAFWQQRFGGAADVIGRSLHLDTVPFTIVGVTPADFFGADVGRTFDVIVPLEDEPLVRGGDTWLEGSGRNFLTILARLEPAQSAEAATVELRSLQPQIREATLGEYRALANRDARDRYLKEPFTVVPASSGHSNVRRRYERPLLTVMAIVALVLVIGCMNIANLLLARATARRHELAVRVALGASRLRIVRQLFVESLVLSGIGAAIGSLIAAWSSRFLVRQLSTPGDTVFLDLSIDYRVLSFTIGLTVVTTLLFGTAPSLRAAQVMPLDALKEQGRMTSDRAYGGLMGWLVAAQVALSVMLVVAAGLLVGSFVSLTSRSVGFQPDRILLVSVDTLGAGVEPTQRIALYHRVREAVRVVPNVADAAVSFVAPGGSGAFTPTVEISGIPLSESGNGRVFANLISPGWFRTFGIPLVAGRDLTRADRRGAPRVALLAGSFGLLALLLAGLGVYGVTAYAVSRQRVEIGIRMALGAAPAAVIGLVLARMLLLVGTGVLVGAGVSVWASRYLGPLLHFVEPRDPATLVGAAAVLAALGTLAGWLPARRAARMNPVAVLREG